MSENIYIAGISKGENKEKEGKPIILFLMANKIYQSLSRKATKSHLK